MFCCFPRCGWGEGDVEKDSQKARTPIYKKVSTGDVMYNVTTRANTV